MSPSRLWICIVLLVVSTTTVFAQTCEPLNVTAVSACTPIDFSATVPQCAQFMTFDTIVTSNLSPIEGLIFIAQQALSQIPDTLPDSCRLSLLETTCKSIFMECVEVPFGPITVAIPKNPCKAICSKATDYCAQLFSFAPGQAPPNCEMLNPVTCQPIFVEAGVKYGGVLVPCQPSNIAPFEKGPFYCEDFKGKPETCKKYVGDVKIQASYAFTQKMMAEQAEAAVGQLASLPSSCKPQAEEFICRNFFRKCSKFEPYFDQTALPTTFYWGKPVCRSACKKFNVQCGELFGLSGSNLTDCESVTVELQNTETYPKEESTFTYFETKMNVDCRESDVKDLPKTFRCEKWSGTPKQCNPYLLDKDDDKKGVFILDAFSMEARSNLTTTFVAILKDLPKKCKEYATEMICRTLFQECKTFDDDDLPTTYVVGKPPCKRICKNVKGCEKELRKVGIPVPDCREKDTLTQGFVYPKTRTEFLIPDHSYSAACIDSIHNPRHKKRDTRDVEEEGLAPKEDEEVERDEEEDEENVDEEEQDQQTDGDDELNTFNIAAAIADSLSSITGVDHQSNVVNRLQADGAFDKLIRSVSEQVARRVQL